MNKARYAFAVLAGIASAALPVLLFAQSGPSAPTAAPYRPGLGDLMTMTVQPRHIKLGLAARDNNWSYAAYELHELEEAFERVARHSPQWRKKPIAEMMASVTKEPSGSRDGDQGRRCCEIRRRVHTADRGVQYLPSECRGRHDCD